MSITDSEDDDLSIVWHSEGILWVILVDKLSGIFGFQDDEIRVSLFKGSVWSKMIVHLNVT